MTDACSMTTPAQAEESGRGKLSAHRDGHQHWSLQKLLVCSLGNEENKCTIPWVKNWLLSQFSVLIRRSLIQWITYLIRNIPSNSDSLLSKLVKFQKGNRMMRIGFLCSQNSICHSTLPGNSATVPCLTHFLRWLLCCFSFVLKPPRSNPLLHLSNKLCAQLTSPKEKLEVTRKELLNPCSSPLSRTHYNFPYKNSVCSWTDGHTAKH